MINLIDDDRAKVKVVGAGLAGAEAAWQLALRGIQVELYDMKPQKRSPAHKSELFGELVCSNSLKAMQLTNASGLQKEELRRLRSLIMEAADASSVPAGGALAVDRDRFAAHITQRLRGDPNITIINEEVTRIGGGIWIIATGPLTSDPLSAHIAQLVGQPSLHFFDAAAPIISADGIDRDKAFAASRYGKGEGVYLNCPFDEEEYSRFYDALITAETAPLHEFESDTRVFEGCMPIEVMAKRGVDTIRYGPLKPVGLPDPKTGREPYAVVQLRSENESATMYNLVGFQTNLKFGEQKRVFSMIPGLEGAEFLRYGVMHRNTFLDSPRLLDNDFSLRANPDIYFAGQLTGVEGYIESAASGLVAGINAARRVNRLEKCVFPATTVTGALAAYISDPNIAVFQPMNANFGVIEPLDHRVKGGKTAKYEAFAERSLVEIEKIKAEM